MHDHRTSLRLAPWLAALLLSACTPAQDPAPREPASDDDRAAEPGSIWAPSVGTTWQWQLSGALDLGLDVQAYDVDLYTTSDAEIAALREAGRAVICYFSAGSYEPYRPDAADFPADAIGEIMDGWPDERWIDTRSQGVRDVLAARLDYAKARGCDAVECDNVDGFENETGFDLDGESQLDFNRFLAEEAHARGLSVGLKNDVGQLAELVDHFDWALNEECVAFEECEAYGETFIAAGKAVFHAEYVAADERDAVCDVTRPIGLSTLIKRQDLDAWQLDCAL